MLTHFTSGHLFESFVLARLYLLVVVAVVMAATVSV